MTSTDQVKANQLAAAKLGVQIPGSSGGTDNGSGNDSFLGAIQDKLLKQSDLISSSNTGLEDKIAAAIKGVQSSTDATDASITSAYGRESAFQKGQAATQVGGILDSRSGYATNTALLRNVNAVTEKSLRDLDQRKEELILQNDSAGASKIADMQIQALQFQQQAQQQAFTNLLSLGNMSIQIQGQQQQAAQAKAALEFNEQSAMSAIATKYGLTVGPDDTIASITSKAAPFASKEEQLQLEQLQTSIQANQAQTASAMSAVKANQPLSATDLEALARAYQSSPDAVLGVVKTPAQLGQILSKVGEVTMGDLTTTIISNSHNGGKLTDDVAAINSNPNLSPQQKADAIGVAEKAYNSTDITPKPFSFTKAAVGAASGFNSMIDGLVNGHHVVGYDHSGKAVYGKLGQKLSFDSAGNPIVR